jgi:hypothetical protein
MKYKAQVVDGHKSRLPDPIHADLEFEPLLQKALDDGVAKGWKLFSVSEATTGITSPHSYQLTVTLIWEVPPPKPTTPQEVERERRREVERERRREVERERKRVGRTTAG